MKILYLAFARIPTEKAHGLTIVKSCESFARAGAEVTLVVPKRRTQLQGDIFAIYGVERNFRVREVRVPDLIGYFGNSRFAYWVHFLLFNAAVKLSLLFASRAQTIYTRDALFALYSWLGYKTVLECHAIAKQRGLYFFCAHRAHRIVTISHALKDAFIKAGFDGSRILVAPSGVDIATFDIPLSKEAARKELSLPQAAQLAVYTGNFTTMGEDKGIADIIAALPGARDITFVAVGGSEKDIARYAALAKEKGVAERVILRGYAPQGELAKYQKAADVLLMPFPDKPHYRNHMSPVKMFEYMASGRPIIASGLPTIREVLNEKNAYLVRPGDSSAIARELQAVFAQPDEAKARTAHAREDVRAYAWDRRSERIYAFIEG